MYLFLHAFYLVLFLVAKIYIMVYVVAGIIALYLLFFLLIKFKKYLIYALSVGNEFFAFIILATLMLGFSTGFHFFLIGFCVVSFFTTYFSTKKNIKGSFLWVGLSMAIYLTLYFVTKFNKPYYEVDAWLELTLFTTHAVIVFLIISGFLSIFLRYAFSLEKKIISESRTDELTQISNRYGLYDFFDSEKDKSTQVLALFDIDDFKVINDTCGHAAGDIVLKRVAEVATQSLGDAFVCRYGGEEFVAVLDDKPQNPALDRLEEFRKVIETEEMEYEGQKIHLTITIGAAKYMNGLKLDRWVELADQKMYNGKKAGKNKTII
jgi:diguanylate cyclase (GGDEF)-like protein